jgi:predicted Zn-dependent protease
MNRSRFFSAMVFLAGLLGGNFWDFSIYSYAAGPCVGERERALAFSIRIEDRWPTRDRQDRISAFVQELGEKLISASQATRRLRWSFTVVRDLSLKAFSIGGGFVYISDGALLISRTESELAAIIAHEIGHELAGHFCDSNRDSGLWSTLPGLAGFGDESPDWRPGSSKGRVRQVVDIERENEADRFAAELLYAAGYDPRALLEVAMRLPEMDHHLDEANRIGRLERLVAKFPQGHSKDSTEFQDVRDFLRKELER